MPVRSLSSQTSFAGELIQWHWWQWLVLALVGILVYLLNYFQITTPITATFEQALLPMRTAAYNTYQNLRQASHSIENLPNLLQENQSLTQETIELRSRLAEVEGVFSENEQLQRETGIVYEREYTQLGALVVGYDSYNPGQVLLNKGRSSQIQIGDIAVIEKILLGRVVEVNEHSSRVDTLITPNTSLPVKTVEQPLGILSVRNANQLVVGQILQSAEIEKGQKVYTSGLDNTYPPDLYIGEIVEIEADVRASTKTAVIRPVVDYLKLSRLKILSYGE